MTNLKIKNNKPTVYMLKVFQFIGKRFLGLRQTLYHRCSMRANEGTNAVIQQEDEMAVAVSQEKVIHSMSFQPRWMSSMDQFNLQP